MAAKKSTRKPKQADLDPVERAPFPQRRGTLAAFDYNSWEASSILVGNDLDAIAKRLAATKKVGLVDADVTEAALAGTLDSPDAPHLLIVKLKGHDWAPVHISFAERYDTDAVRDLSRDAGTKVIWCRHQDTAGATAFWLFDRGKPIIEFETTGEEYLDGGEGEFPTRFKSSLHKKDWWRQHEDEDAALQALVKEQQAYVPMVAFSGDKKRGKIGLYAYPEDTLDRVNVERILLAVYGPATKAKPAAAAKALREAVERLDIAAVEAALKAGADQRFLPGSKYTALSHAVDHALRDPDRGVPVIDALLRGGAGVNDPGNGNPPIWDAIDAPQDKARKLPILLRLIAAGADLNAKALVSHQKGSAPLHYVAQAGDVEMARFLVAHEADVSVKNSRGETPRQSAAGILKTMLQYAEADEESEAMGQVVAFLEQFEKGKLKPSDLSKNPQPIIDAERARNAKLKRELEASLAKLENPIVVRPTREKKRKAPKKKATGASAKLAAVHSQPKKIKVKPTKFRDGAWLDGKRRDRALDTLKARGFELIGSFEASPGFDFLQMIALLHPKQHVFAVVCEILSNTWIDFVQYYSDGTQLNLTNVKSTPEAHIDIPRQRKVRQPKWGVTKLIDFILKEPPPTGAKVVPLKPKEFAKRFEDDYAWEMKNRGVKSTKP